MSHPYTFQNKVAGWGRVTFPHATPTSIVLHLTDETGELREAVSLAELATGTREDRAARLPAVREEAADVYLLLLHLADRYGFDLEEAAREKFAIVQTRTYTTDSGRGYIRHDEEIAS